MEERVEARVKERVEARVKGRMEEGMEERERMKTTMPTIIFPVPTHVELTSGESWEIELDAPAGVNKKQRKFKTVWHGFRRILKLSGRVNQASLKLSAGF